MKKSEPIKIQVQMLKKIKYNQTMNRITQSTTTSTEKKKTNEWRPNFTNLTSSTRNGESLTNSSLATNSPLINFSPLLNEAQALQGLVDDRITNNSNDKLKKQEAPSKVMHTRWLESVKKQMPSFDVEDLPKAYVQSFDLDGEYFKKSPSHLKKRQFAPEFSNKIYQEAIAHEYAIGNFFAEQECHLDITEEARFTMVQLIEQIH